MRRFPLACLLAALLAVSADPGVLSAQSPAVAALSSAEAPAFIGAWTLAIDADGQVFNLDLVIRDADGALAGEVNSEFGSSRVTQFRRNGESLVLSYSAEMNGESFPVVITMSPTADGADLLVDAAQGNFVARGKGTRK